MAKDSQKIEREFIATAAEKTGHDLDGWMAIIGRSGLDKTNAIIQWLKQDHSLNHMQASILAGIYLNDGKPVFDYEVLLERLFDGKDQQRPLYDELAHRIQSDVENIHFIPTKTYISLENERVFGCVKINNTNLRVGLDLGDRPFDGDLQQARGLGAMPNIGHMIEISSEAEISAALIGHVAAAYERAQR
jgi:predicted transport protein